MSCPKCQINIEAGVQNCLQCGKLLQVPIVTPEIKQTLVNSPKKSKKTLLIILLLVFIVLLAYGVYELFSINEPNINDNQNTQLPELETDISNFRFIATINKFIQIEDEDEEETKEISIVHQGIFDRLNQTQHTKIETQNTSELIKLEVYTNFETRTTYTREPLADNWVIEENVPVNSIVNLPEIIEELSKAESVTRTNDEIYNIGLTEEQIKNIMIGIDNTFNVDDLEFNNEINALIHIRDGLIFQIEYDFSDLIASIDSFTIVIEFSDFNTAGEVIIPEDLLNNGDEAIEPENDE